MSIVQTGRLPARGYSRLEGPCDSSRSKARGVAPVETAAPPRDRDAPYSPRVRTAILMVGAGLAWAFTLLVLRAALAH